MRILVVEDEFAIAKVVRNAFEQNGDVVTVAETAQRGLELADAWKPDVVLLDVMLPDGDGRELARRIRTTSDVPIVMVTARGEERDRIEGLDVADDYVVKPFSMGELMARVRAVVRRARGDVARRPARLEHADLALDTETRRVTQAGRTVPMGQREFEILRMLMERPARVVSRADLAHSIWGRSAKDAAKTLDVHMSWLRRKLGDSASEPLYIETVRGAGFRLVPRE